MTDNLGQSTLRRKYRAADPMALYDDLPPALRKWLAEARLPWSPVSARRIWSKSLARGQSRDEALQALSRAEARTLARDKVVKAGGRRTRG